DFRGDLCIAVDRRGIEPRIYELAHGSDFLRDQVALFRFDLGVRKEQGTIKMTKEQSLGESQFLGTGEQQLFGLLSLLRHLFRRQWHGHAPWGEWAMCAGVNPPLSPWPCESRTRNSPDRWH